MSIKSRQVAGFMVLAMVVLSIPGCCNQPKTKVVINTPCPKTIEGEEIAAGHGTSVEYNIIDHKEIDNGQNQSSL